MEAKTEQRKVKTAVVFTGGGCHTEKVKLPDAPDLTVAADSGLKTARACGVRVDLLAGDFDSYTDELPGDAEIVRVPAEKDMTDTVLACDLAIERGAREILIVGGTGGRLDHELSNLFYLEVLRRRGIRAALTDGENTARVLIDEECTVPQRGGYFSVFALDTEGCEVSLSGCRYPLENARLTRADPSLGVSNEVVGAYAVIKVRGAAMVMTSVK